MVVQYRKRTIQLFEHEHAGHVMRERQRRQRPLSIGSLADGFCRSSEASNDECQPPLIFVHVPAKECGQLAGTPHRSVGIEKDDTIGSIERSKNSGRFVLKSPLTVSCLHILQFGNFNWKGVRDMGGKVFGK